MDFNLYNLGHHLPCLIGTEFHAYEASGPNEKDFNSFLCIFPVSF